MKTQTTCNSRKAIGLLLLSAVGLSGCEKQGYSVLAATGTVIGVEVSQNPATQTPQAKLGYNRGELAFVPTNRSGGKEASGFGQGATDTGEVIMELRYGGIFDVGGSSGIYQRLAVGKTAVQQKGAAYMFAKDEDGTLDTATANAIASESTQLAVNKVIERHKTQKQQILDFVALNGTLDKEKFKVLAKGTVWQDIISNMDFSAFKQWLEETPQAIDDLHKNIPTQ